MEVVERCDGEEVWEREREIIAENPLELVSLNSNRGGGGANSKRKRREIVARAWVEGELKRTTDRDEKKDRYQRKDGFMHSIMIVGGIVAACVVPLVATGVKEAMSAAVRSSRSAVIHSFLRIRTRSCAGLRRY